MPGQSQSASELPLKAVEATALKNHPSVGLAREEEALADLKRQAAKRALFPTLTAKGEETHGDAVDPLGTPAFTERSYGLELTQTIYSGGKLHDTYYQSVATWMSLKAKERKVESDVIYGVREAAWSFIKAQRMLTIYEKALTDLARERDGAQHLFEKDVISNEVYMQVQSQYNQAEAALESGQADSEARLWQWTAALGLKTPPAYRPAAVPILSTTTITLEECLHLASLNNPDIVIQSKTTEAAMYGSRAGKSLYKPTLSINGFYGRSGGAFDSEDLHLREDWQAGFQISQYFALNTLNLSGFDQHTSPKIGQSTRTVSKTGSASLNILDGYKKKADAKDAEFAFHQADVEKDHSEQVVANSVRDAYANWKKARARLKMTENDYPLTKTDYAIARIKSAHRDVPLSERAIWRNRLAQAEAAREEAAANYQIALAVLAHAIGIPDQFNN
jgi:outer membrane protein TolC